VKEDQEFIKYPTPWEMVRSNLVFPTNLASPMVDENFMVIGHVGWSLHVAHVLPLTSGAGAAPAARRMIYSGSRSI